MSEIPNVVQPRILIVDDDLSNIRFLEGLLDIGGYDEILSVMSGKEALAKGMTFGPDLILLDLHMPGTDGYEVLRVLRLSDRGSVYLPILVFTADATSAARKKALEMGASDFLTKPGDATEILLRIKNFLTMRLWSRQLNDRNLDLEERVQARTRELEDSQFEIVQRLAMAGERRDDDTGEHTWRVGELSGKIAKVLKLPTHVVKNLALAARLHDLGKIAVPDSILLKAGKLTPEEFEVIKKHCRDGAWILTNGHTPLIQMAERIALTHHERFDGSGYPQKLAGESIPIEGRIVSVADVYDALTHSRPYKAAWPRDAAIDEIKAQSGRQFDPQVVAAFLTVSKVR